MIIERIKQRQFINDELKAQTDEFKKKLDSSAIDLLLDKHELFVALFLKFTDSGEMLLKFSSARPLPRKNDHYYCFTLPESLRRYKDWGNSTYGDLIKKETKATEVKCIWHSSSDNPKFVLAGFKGVSEEFRQYVEKAPGGVVTIGPAVPPFEYLYNLEKVSHSHHPRCVEILDANYVRNDWTPVLLSSADDVSALLEKQFVSTNAVILQGPPGTGKTFRIANFCRKICNEGHSVLVTALTNRALMEVADKLRDTLVKYGCVYKTNLSTDESKEVPGVISAEKMSAIPGKLMLSTFYISSGSAANNYEGPLFDYVIVDEASQAFLAMLAAANMLGKKNLWVGDVFQMPPIVQISKERIARQGYEPLINGFDTLTVSNRYKTYQLSDTYRLGKRAVEFTGLFYNGTLRSMINDLVLIAEQKDGPVMINIDMPTGDPMPSNAINKAISLASEILQKDKNCKIAILSQLVKTTMALQIEAARQLGKVNSVLVDTVARVQGLTRDVGIYVIPDTDAKMHSLELRLFNVATSRAKQNTFIICPKNITSYTYMSAEVRNFLNRL
jgi:hypothetical protein